MINIINVIICQVNLPKFNGLGATGEALLALAVVGYVACSLRIGHNLFGDYSPKNDD